MQGTIYCLIDDTKKQTGCKELWNKSDLKKWNDNGWGVYFSVNEFKEHRKEENCIKLRYVYADLDIAKRGDGQTRKEKQEKKQKLYQELVSKCEPTMIIDTSNGLQPLWEITDNEPTLENKKLYKKVLKGIVKWSKTIGSFGDNVYDVSRILRLPEYYHRKEEPYFCDLIHKSSKKYPLSLLEQIFPYSEEQIEYSPTVSDKSNPVFNAIEQIDFRELIIKAFASVGRPVSFDKSGHMIDPIGKTTGTFIGRKGNRDYLASSSHEPFQGNRITAVADILKVDYSDAYKWICSTYNLDFKKLNSEKKKEEKIVEINTPVVRKEKRYTWGTRYLDTHFAIIKPTNFIVVAAKRNSGKTTYTFDMAVKNAEMGNKVLYISLEMDTDDILDDFGRKFSGITIEEEFDYKIPETKKNAYEKRKQEIKNIPNLFLAGIRKTEDITWDMIIEVINRHTETEIVFIDNLDMIAGEDGETEIQRQKRIVKKIMSFTSAKQIPIILIHHYRKSQSGKDYGMDEMSGSGKIGDGADRVVKVVKCSDADAPYPEKYKSTLFLQKGRGYPEHTAGVYFIKGRFLDTPPSWEEYNTHQPTLINIAKDFGGEII